MSSIKQLIVNAIIKVSGENPSLNREGEPTAEQARDDFIKLLLAELFPEDPAVPSPKKTKKTKAKKTEEVVVEKTDAAPEAPKKVKKTKNVAAPEAVAETVAAAAVEAAPETVVPVAAETVAAPASEASPSKKKRAPMTEEAKAAMKAKREATLAAKKAAAAPAADGAGGQQLEEGEVIPTPPKEKKAKKAKVAEDANLPKLDPTWKKHLKNADKEHAKELEPELLKFLNAMSKEDFNAKKAEEHVTAFIKSRKPKEEDEKVEAELIEIEFNGKTYAVNPETKRVYEGEGEFDEETGWTNYKPVGYVGMAAFAEMTLDE